MTIPVEFSYLKDKLGEKFGREAKGNLLVIHSNLTSSAVISASGVKNKVWNKVCGHDQPDFGHCRSVGQ